MDAEADAKFHTESLSRISRVFLSSVHLYIDECRIERIHGLLHHCVILFGRKAATRKSLSTSSFSAIKPKIPKAHAIHFVRLSLHGSG